MTGFAIRPTLDADFDAVCAIHMSGFPTAAEAQLVRSIGGSGEEVVSLVAEQDGGMVGHLLMSRMQVTCDGSPIRGVGLAPVTVLAPYRRQGVASRLIEAGIAASRSQGEEIAFVLGDPAYYTRFGFAAATARPFASPYAGPYFMAMILQPGLRLPKTGRADYSLAFAALDGSR